MNLFKQTNPKNEFVSISSWVRHMVYMFCNRNEMTDNFSYGTTSDLHVVPQNKPRPFVFDFNKVGD